jgi:tRNA U55 pseudouridine synthase TruB
LSALRRTESAPFRIEDAKTMEDLEAYLMSLPVYQKV